MFTGPCHRLGACAGVEEVASGEEGLIGCRVDPSSSSPQVAVDEVAAESSGDGRSDLVLQLEHVFELAIVALAPQVHTLVRLHQLDGDANAPAGTPHATLHDASRTELLSGLPDVQSSAGHGGR